MNHFGANVNDDCGKDLSVGAYGVDNEDDGDDGDGDVGDGGDEGGDEWNVAAVFSSGRCLALINRAPPDTEPLPAQSMCFWDDCNYHLLIPVPLHRSLFREGVLF